MNRFSLTCPACSSGDIFDLGPISENLGTISLADPGRIYRCDRCGLLFRRPFPSPSQLIDVYRTFPANYWNYTERRIDFDMAVQAIANLLSSGRILDVGCYRGDFLAMLPDRYQKYGIEPAKAAQEVARERGITLVGSFLEQVDPNSPQFHLITLLDVIEHLPRPMDALRRVEDLLLPGGFVIISTGNTDFPLWKLMRRDYWYYCPEHVTFTNRRWFDWAAKQLDLDIVRFKRISHTKGSTFKKRRQLINCLLYKILEIIRPYPRFYNLIVYLYPFNRVKNWSFAPLADHLKDHMFIVLKSKRDS